MSKRVIGLLGGSFNPAHAGHLHISEYALNKLGISEIWWLVSPHNPLKAKDSLADYQSRFSSARAITRGKRRISVCDFEAKHRLQFTCDTLALLKKKNPSLQFVWLMGADNLVGFHRWQRWQWLAKNIPMIVFDRAPYSHAAKRAKAYEFMRKFLIKDSEINPRKSAPWLYFAHMGRINISASMIRKTLEKKAVLGHNKVIGQK